MTEHIYCSSLKLLSRKPEHITKKPVGEERGLWEVGLHGLLLGPGKVSVETLTLKRARKLRCGTQKWARRWNRAEIMAQNWTIAVGKLASSPLACVPYSHHILLPCACYIGYTYRILHEKCGRTVFSYELLTYFQKSKEWDFWYKNSDLGNTVQSIFHVVLCLLDTETFIIDSASLLFQIFLKG